MGKSTINGPFSIAMLNYQRVLLLPNTKCPLSWNRRWFPVQSRTTTWKSPGNTIARVLASAIPRSRCFRMLNLDEFGFVFTMLQSLVLHIYIYIYIQSCLVVEVASWCFTVCKVTALLDEMTLMDLMVFSSGSSQAPCATIICHLHL